MSSGEDKCSLQVAHSDSDHSVSTDLQEEYEELLRYAIVNPNVESSASQPPHLKGEVAPDRFPMLAGNNPIRETALEVEKGSNLNISSHSGSPRKPPHPVMDFFSSHFLDDSSSPASLSTRTDAHEIVVGDHLVSDENFQKLENVLDVWSSGLKTNIFSELSKWRLNFIDWHRMEMKKEKEKHAVIVKQLTNQIDDLKELQKAFEISIGRKDEVLFSMLPLSETQQMFQWKYNSEIN